VTRPIHRVYVMTAFTILSCRRRKFINGGNKSSHSVEQLQVAPSWGPYTSLPTWLASIYTLACAIGDASNQRQKENKTDEGVQEHHNTISVEHHKTEVHPCRTGFAPNRPRLESNRAQSNRGNPALRKQMEGVKKHVHHNTSLPTWLASICTLACAIGNASTQRQKRRKQS